MHFDLNVIINLIAWLLKPYLSRGFDTLADDQVDGNPGDDQTDGELPVDSSHIM